ncbi:hypothetical protein AALO_G00293870 [Alosa alosa]|uniref:Uncharacterized protein n=1 Tax=Alosa alosa TaxID=278164 RepID=A0AAV6FMC8_9TELE|nr:hypothetical protein AALO_G00293870 [Alosa alosa]
MTASSQQYVSYLYERLYAKLSDDSFHDNWSIVGFVIIFLFCCLMITLFMTVLFTSCCGRYFESPPIKMNRVGALPATPSEPTFLALGESHIKVYSAPSTAMDKPAHVKESGSQKKVANPAPQPPAKSVDKPKKSKHKNKGPKKVKSQSQSKKQLKETH